MKTLQVASILCTIVSCLLMLYVAYLMIFVVPKFEQIFRDLNIKLPASTVICIDLVNWGLGYAIIVMVIAMVIKEFFIKSVASRLGISIIGILICGAVWGYVQMAMFQPLITIIDQLNDGGAT